MVRSSALAVMQGAARRPRQIGHVDGLVLVPVEPGGHDLLPVLGHHGRRHRHHGNLPRGFLGSKLSERFDPVNPGQPNVHQDQVRASLLGEADAGFSRLGLDGGVTP